jgi:uncharacterized DUF497 family protein
MTISYDPAKREQTLQDRGLDFEDAPLVFAGLTVEVEDTRKDYGERRIICFGQLEGRLVVIKAIDAAEADLRRVLPLLEPP